MREYILLGVGIVAMILIFVFFSVVNSKMNSYQEKQNESNYHRLIELLNEIEITDNNLFPMIEKYTDCVSFKIFTKSEERKCLPFDNLVKKGYKANYTEPIYIIDNNLKNKFETKIIDGNKYLILEPRMKTIELILVFYGHDTLHFRFQIKYSNKSYTIESKELMKYEQEKN